MGDNTVDKLQIEIEASAGKASTELDRLAASLRKLQSVVQLPGLDRVVKQLHGLGKTPSLSGMEKELARLEKQAEKDGNALLALQNKLESLQAFKGVGNPLTVADTDSQIKQVEQQIRELSKAIDDADVRIRTLRKNISEGMAGASAPIELAAQKISQAAQSNVSDSGIRRAADSCDDLAKAAQRAQKSLGSASESASKLAGSAKMVQQSSSGLDRVSGAARRVESSLSSASRGAERLGKTVEAAGTRGASGLDKLAARLKSMAVNFLVFHVINKLVSSIGDSLGEMAKENEGVNKTLSKIASSVKYVSDALTAVVYPVIVALEPVITAVLDGLAEVLNFIARIVAFFTGQDYVIQAKKTQVDYAESLGNTADSMESVTNAAKEMRRWLLPIDELNIIGDQDDSSGKGGGLSNPRFEEIKNDLKLPDTIKSPRWDPNPIPAPEFAPLAVPEWATVTLESPAWSPAVVTAPAFEALPVPELAGQRIPAPEWEPQIIRAPQFDTVIIPEAAGQKLTSPEWSPSLIPAPSFGALILPEWANSPLPVPAWEANPILAPAIDFSPVLSSLPQLEGALATTQQTILDFETVTQGIFIPWGENIRLNYATTMNYLPAVTSPALSESAESISAYLTTTSEAFAEWGQNVAANVQTTLAYLPEAVSSGLSAAGQSVSQWLNQTSQGFAAWGQNLFSNGAKAISGFVNNFVSGLSSAWENFAGFMSATGEKVSGWWSANKSWVVPVGAAALAGVAIGAIVLSGGSALAAAPTLAKVALPALAFADGGVVKSPTLGLIGEYPGAASNPEIIAPQSILKQTLQESQDNTDVINAVFAIGNMIVKAIEEKESDINLDGQSLARGIQPYQNRLNSLQGSSLVD